MQVGSKVCLVAKPTIKGTIVARPDATKNSSFFNNPDIIWIDTDTIGLAWAYKCEVLPDAPVVQPVVQEKPVVKSPKAKAKSPKVSVNTVNFRRLVAVDLIRKQRGKFFTAVFVGKDGVEHTCNGRTGVVKYLKGEVVKQLPEDLLNAFNVKKMEYRNIFLDGISEIRAEGKIFTFDKVA